MESELSALALTAATTVVSLLATDLWSRAKTAVVAVWQRVRPDRVAAIDASIEQARKQAIAARRSGDEGAEKVLIDDLRLRLGELLTDDPAAASHLQRLVSELGPLLPTARAAWTGDVHMDTKVSGQGRVYQVGQGEMHIAES